MAFVKIINVLMLRLSYVCCYARFRPIDGYFQPDLSAWKFDRKQQSLYFVVQTVSSSLPLE